jgi:predicted PurR-regulated permease PerM
LTTEASAKGRFNFAPILTATVLTVLLLWLFKTVAQVFLLLFLGILISLYLGAVADWLERRLQLPATAAFLAAVIGSLGALVLLGYILIPPVVAQTEALIKTLPSFITTWEQGLDEIVKKFPSLAQEFPPGQHRMLMAIYERLQSGLGDFVPRAFGVFNVAINIFAVMVMGIYLALHPALYREWLIALFPPIHRDLVRDVLGDLANSLRAYIVGQLLTMTFLGAITALGLYILDVPFWGVFGIFTGLVAVIPFFGTLLSTTLPALFVLNETTSYHGMSGVGHAALVIGLGVVVHLIEGNVVSPLVMSKKVDLPPVLTIMAVLVMGRLLGPLGLIVALPTLAALMVIVRRILITRIYEGQGFRRTARERPMLLRVPVTGGGVLTPVGPAVDIITLAERQGINRAV